MPSEWTETPFETLERARQVSIKLGGKPFPIIELPEKGIRYFLMKESRRKTYLIAQSLAGGPVREKLLKVGEKRPPMQDPHAPAYREEDKGKAGRWRRSQHTSFEDVREYYRKQFVNPDNLEILDVILIRVDNAEYEYARDSRGVWARVIEYP